MVGWILDSRRILDVPDRLTNVTSWHTHVPFAFWCVEKLRPRVFVELGTHRGDSYSAFCQAVAGERLPTACYAVDTWRGDPQAGEYGEEIYQEIRRYHDPRYGAFSRLIRATFDEAVGHFADASIDLLHIDGLHTYEAVRHDLETWAPRLSSSAVVLFHDVNVREADFGAWRLWDELCREHPSFTFRHGHGLGVLLWGKDAPEPAKRLAASTPEEAAEIRSLFSHLGEAMAAQASSRQLEELLAAAEASSRRLEELLAAATEEAGRKEEERLEQERALEEEKRAREAAERELALTKEALARSEGSGTRLEKELEGLREGSGGRSSLARLTGRLGHGLRVALTILYWTVTFQLPAGLRRRKYARLIRRAQLFDPEFYLAQLEEPSRARRDPIDHYLAMGSAAGLDPNPFFDTSWYRERYPDVAGKEPLVHFIRYGAREGRPASRRFDTAYYLCRNPEVKDCGLNPLAHYLRFGQKQGLACVSPSPVGRDEGEELPALGAGSEADAALVVDRRVPTPRQDSGSVRMFAILKLLRQQGIPVTLAADQTDPDDADRRALTALGVDVVLGKDAIAAHLRDHGRRYSLALLSRPEEASRYIALVRAHALHARVVYDTVDLHWRRMARAASVTGDAGMRIEAERMRRLECTLAEAADVALTVTPDEQRELQAAVPSARVEVIPNIHSVRANNRPWSARRDLMFIGGFEHEPNADAVEWFVNDILPLVRQQLPGVVLRVVGSKMPDRLKALESSSVKMLGWVRDVSPVFESARVFVAPLRFGAGMLGKIGQSIEHGLPVVTTDIGAEGMGLVDGETALVANAAKEFAAAVVRLYQDERLWTRLARDAALLVHERFSEKAIQERLQQLRIGDVAAGAGAAGAGRRSA